MSELVLTSLHSVSMPFNNCVAHTCIADHSEPFRLSFPSSVERIFCLVHSGVQTHPWGPHYVKNPVAIPSQRTFVSYNG